MPEIQISAKNPRMKSDETYAHQDFTITADHANPAALDLHWSRLGCADLITEGFVEHLECERLVA